MASDIRISARLFNKKRSVAQTETDCAPREEPQQPSAADDDGLSSAAQKQRRYRERLKADPENYEFFKQKNKERMAMAREKMTQKKKLANWRCQECKFRGTAPRRRRRACR